MIGNGLGLFEVAVRQIMGGAAPPPDPHPGNNLLLETNDLLLLENGTDAILLEP